MRMDIAFQIVSRRNCSTRLQWRPKGGHAAGPRAATTGGKTKVGKKRAASGVTKATSGKATEVVVDKEAATGVDYLRKMRPCSVQVT